MATREPPRSTSTSPHASIASSRRWVESSTEAPRWQAKTVARTATATTIHLEKKTQPAVVLLNAARVQGLAARTRDYLSGRGFSSASIGDAPVVRAKSLIVYSPTDAVRAERLAAQFGFALQRRTAEKSGVVILLGRDAARSRALRLVA